MFSSSIYYYLVKLYSFFHFQQLNLQSYLNSTKLYLAKTISYNNFIWPLYIFVWNLVYKNLFNQLKKRSNINDENLLYFLRFSVGIKWYNEIPTFNSLLAEYWIVNDWVDQVWNDFFGILLIEFPIPKAKNAMQPDETLDFFKIKLKFIGNTIKDYFFVVKINDYKQILFVYLSIFYNFVKKIIIALVIVIFLVLVLWDYYSDDLDTMVGIWLIVGFLAFWLFSGFNFFLKRYRFGKFTSAIQRFWKRTNSYFWLIEGFLFSLFFYYYLNSSQEPLYFYDESNLNQDQLLSLLTSYYSSFLLIFIIFYSFYVLLNLVNFTFKQSMVHLTIISILFIYVFLLECYQFYYVITMFYENVFVFQGTLNSWLLDIDSPRMRTKLQYLVLGAVAKYWHFLFIFFFWLFTIYKFYEKKRVSYVLLGAAIQNFLILVGLNLLFSVYWIKWIFRRFYDIIYYWFFTDTNNSTVINFFTELYLFVLNFFNVFM